MCTEENLDTKVKPLFLLMISLNRGDYYKYLKMEQDGESLHHKLNELDKQFACVKNMIKELENHRRNDKKVFDTKKRSKKNSSFVQLSSINIING